MFHGGLLGRSHTDCFNETTDLLQSPDETAHHRYSFHPVQMGISRALEKRWVENDCSAEKEVIPITLTWVSSSAAYLHTVECVNLISLLLFRSLSPVFHLLF